MKKFNPSVIFKKVKDKVNKVFKKKTNNTIQEQLTGKTVVESPKPKEVYKNKTGKQDPHINIYDDTNFLKVGKYENTMRQSIQENRKKRINSDIIITGIAIGLLLGVVLFFFQGVQPMMLDKYTTQVNEQIDNVSKRYSDQVKGLERLQNSLATNAMYDKYLSCVDNNLYNSMESDLRMVEVNNAMISPDLNYKELEKYQNIIHLDEVDQIYNNFYNEYSTNINEIIKMQKDIELLPRYLEYRNSWIETCQNMKGEDGNEIVEKCTNLVTKTEEYENGETIAEWEEALKPFADNIKRLCTKIPPKDNVVKYAAWELAWIDNFNKIVSYQIDYDSNVEKMNILQEEMKSGSKKVKLDINKIYNLKTEFKNIWYILDL